MTRDEINEWLVEHGHEDETILLMDGLDEAFLGLATRFEPIAYQDEDGLARIKGGTHRTFAVYDYDKIIASLVADGMDEDEAEEFYGFNIEGAYAGETTPAIMVVAR